MATKHRTAKKPVPDYDNRDGRGMSRKAQLTDSLSRWIASLVAQGWSFHRILNHPNPPEGLPKSLETVLNWLTYGDQCIHRKGDKHSTYAVFADRIHRATEIAALAGYDQLLDLEARLSSEPKYLDNPDYDAAVALQCLKEGKDYPEPKFLHNPRHIDVATAQCIMGSIRWRIARLKPEKFGDKLEIYRHISVEHKLSDDAPDWLQKLAGPKAGQVIDATPEDRAPQLPVGKASKSRAAVDLEPEKIE